MTNSTKTVETLQSRARSAIDWIDKIGQEEYGLWFVLGMSKTKWEDDSRPPYPSPTLTKVPEPLGYFKVDTVRLVYPDTRGGIYTPYGRYEYISETTNISEVAAARATHVYISRNIEKGVIPSGFYYRMLGLCRDIKFSPNLANTVKRKGLTTTNLRPNQVVGYTLDWVATFTSRSTTDIEGVSRLQMVRSY